MKTLLLLSRRRRSQGTASIVVLLAMFILAALAINNARTVAHLEAELRLIEARQLNKFKAVLPQKAGEAKTPSPDVSK